MFDIPSISSSTVMGLAACLSKSMPCISLASTGTGPDGLRTALAATFGVPFDLDAIGKILHRKLLDSRKIGHARINAKESAPSNSM